MHGAVADLIAEDATTWWQVQLLAGHPSAERVGAAAPVPEARWRRIWQQSEEPTAGGRPRRARIWRS
jgi:hypothetical protein